jgi:hypothetical protein
MKRLAEQLRPPLTIQKFMEGNEEWAQTRARQLGIVAKYVTTQALLHLPYYTPETITDESLDVLRELDAKVIKLGEEYANSYNRLHDDTEMSLITSEAVL